MSARNGEDRSAIYTYDFAKGALGQRILAHPKVDLEYSEEGEGIQPIYSPVGHHMVGLMVQAEKPEVYWLNDAWANAQAMADKALPGTINQLSGDPKGRLLVGAFSDVDPGHYYLLDVSKKQIEDVLAPQPWIDPSQMSPMQVYHYVARDGLDIPAYLTLPKGRPAKDLPLVALIHGGPYARDEWGYNPEVQFLANRGYAVLQPEFRGSIGFGWKLFTGGWKTWGLAMQDDITDGIESLAKQGIIDKKRICIMGASYGGYATMMGLVKDPDLYRCGINYVGVTDIKLMYDVTWSDFSDSPWQRYGMHELIGDPQKDSAQLDATSPIKQAAKIKAPVLMAYGSEDRRVPVIHGQKMRDALEKNKVPVEWMVMSGEAHGWLKEESNYQFYGAVERFLDKYNPAK